MKTSNDITIPITDISYPVLKHLAYIYIYIYIYICVCVCTHTHIYIHTYIHSLHENSTNITITTDKIIPSNAPV